MVARRPIITLVLGLVMMATTASASSPGRRDVDGFVPVMYCISTGYAYNCFVTLLMWTESLEVIGETGRVDVSPGGWGSDPNNGNCGDCLTPYPQRTDDPPEPILEEGEACGGGSIDARDVMIGEYKLYNPGWTPQCSDFQSGGGTANFSWPELNHYPGNEHTPHWGYVTSGIWSSLEATRSAYSDQPIQITSGYRCPYGNFEVGGVLTSKHTKGTAVDMKRPLSAGDWTETEFGILKSAALNSGFTSGLNWDSYADRHLHLER